MYYLNENKTLKELREKGFAIWAYSALYEINPITRLAFDLSKSSDDYLRYIGIEYSVPVGPDKYKKEIDVAFKELKESGFVIEK